MITSANLTKIAPAFLKVQQAITSVHKGANNPFFKSKYADLPSVIDAVKAALNDNGITYLQTPSPSEPGQLALTTRLLHESGEWIQDTASCPLAKADPQGYGSAITYLRRYGLQSICGLYAEDDDGNSASRQDFSRSHQGDAAGLPPKAATKTPAAQKSAPTATEQPASGDWRKIVMHFSKKKGMSLGEFTPDDLAWWDANWQPKPFNGKLDPKDVALRAALTEAVKAHQPAFAGRSEDVNEDVPF